MVKRKFYSWRNVVLKKLLDHEEINRAKNVSNHFNGKKLSEFGQRMRSHMEYMEPSVHMIFIPPNAPHPQTSYLLDATLGDK